MIDLRPVLAIVGSILCLLAAAMALPAAADAMTGHDEWKVFAACGGLTLFVGLALLLGARSGVGELAVRQVYLAATCGLVVPLAFAALPLAFGPLQLSMTDAVFEATSGLTTTSATVLAGLDGMPRGLLLWRALLQWLGGIGVVVLAVTVLPALAMGGMQVFRIESAAPSDRATPRTSRVGSAIVAIYAGMTAVLAAALWLAGMSGFDAWGHAMTTISAGGFSTADASIGRFDSAAVEVVVTVGMVLGGMPFLLFYHASQGNMRFMAHDQQLRWYLVFLLLATTAVSLWLAWSRGLPALDALRHAALTVASVMTGTGLFTLDFGGWDGLPLAILFFLVFVGGCAGSAAGGIKVFRFQFLFANALVQMRRLLRPHAVLIPSFNRRPIPDDVLESVMGFLFVYALGFAVLALSLAYLGLDFMTAVSGAASAIANFGQGLGGEIGPGGSYAALPDAAKWLLAAGMVFGRLELFTVLVLFVPAFWRQ
ncbi:MAG: potassium transporter TrkH [Magnetospirillum sp.]|nr:potassium transporter TrkH [Magnetospirillum sp.]